MLTIFRRHTPACKQTHAVNGAPRDMGRSFRKCACPIHVEGSLRGAPIRKACGTLDWSAAQNMVRDYERAGIWGTEEAKPAVTIREAVDAFLASVCTASAGRTSSTVRGMRSTIDAAEETYKSRASKRSISVGLAEYCAARGLKALEEITLPVLVAWADTWVCKPNHRAKRIRLTRRFFYFCMNAKYTDNNPAKLLETPKGRSIKVTPKVPFDKNSLPCDDGPEMSAIFREARKYNGGGTTALKLYALICLMRYAGLRISDAATFSTSRIAADGSIWLQQAKTGEAIYLPMHDRIRFALSQIAPDSEGRYFTSGVAKLATATDNWRARLTKVFNAAGITGGHAHRFRHTFAVDLLMRGVPIEVVSQACGHTSVKVTEKHYLAGRRVALGAAMRTAWAMTPTATVEAPLGLPAPVAAPAPVVIDTLAEVA